jgi:hypothetical protein
LDAQGRWTGSLDQLELKRPWPLRLSAPAQITAGSGILVIEQLRATLLDGEFGPATLRAEKGRINTNGAFRGISVARLLPRNSGLVDAGLRLGGQWTLALENTWTGKASLHRESGDLSLTGEPPVPLALRKALLNLNAADSGIDIAADIDSGAMGTAAGQLQTRLIRKDGVWMLPGEAPLSGNINLDFRSMAWLRAAARPGACCWHTFQPACCLSVSQVPSLECPSTAMTWAPVSSAACRAKAMAPSMKGAASLATRMIESMSTFVKYRR